MQDTRPSIGGQRNVQCRGVTDDFCGNRTPVWKSASAHLPQAANFHGHCIGSVVEVFFIFLFETFATIYACGRVGNKVSMIYIMDIYHDFIMIFCGENIMIYIDENIRTILL
jgi:hypothetical protein